MTLKELRKQSKKTATEVAAALGVATSSYYNHERGERRLSLESVLTLARLFDVTEREVIESHFNSIAIAKSNNIIR